MPGPAQPFLLLLLLRLRRLRRLRLRRLLLLLFTESPVSGSSAAGLVGTWLGQALL
jgi:hypothetical protein